MSSSLSRNPLRIAIALTTQKPTLSKTIPLFLLYSCNENCGKKLTLLIIQMSFFLFFVLPCAPLCGHKTRESIQWIKLGDGIDFGVEQKVLQTKRCTNILSKGMRERN